MWINRDKSMTGQYTIYWNATNEYKTKLSDISCFVFNKQFGFFFFNLCSRLLMNVPYNVSLLCKKKINFCLSRRAIQTTKNTVNICIIVKIRGNWNASFSSKNNTCLSLFSCIKFSAGKPKQNIINKITSWNVVVYGLRCIVVVVVVVRHQKLILHESLNILFSFSQMLFCLMRVFFFIFFLLLFLLFSNDSKRIAKILKRMLLLCVAYYSIHIAQMTSFREIDICS